MTNMGDMKCTQNCIRKFHRNKTVQKIAATVLIFGKLVDFRNGL
jgi:hypothetical protein